MARQTAAGRTPPGQSLTSKWPVLHYGSVPRFNAATWDFRLFGLVEQPVTLTHEEFFALPKTTLTCDIHCVTQWSRLGVTFEGFAATTVLGLAKIRPEAKYVMVHGEQGYETNIPVEYLQAADALFAHKADGEDLTPDHGYPLRLVIPRLYFWKSAKWVRGLEFLAGDRPGFWERNGYHMRGDPWREERYSTPW
jgi:DMSO/TMAO reductase YedYZ molybdopterin-dependent catalytic subunit